MMGCVVDLLADTNGGDDDKDPALNEDGRQRLLVAHILRAVVSHHIVGEVRVQAHACHIQSCRSPLPAPKDKNLSKAVKAISGAPLEIC